MKKYIRCLALCLVGAMLLGGCNDKPADSSAPADDPNLITISPDEADFFVAENGSDDWSGTLAEPNADKTDGPFATPARAKAAVADKNRESGDAREEITVMLRGGTYYLADTLMFGVEDSGTEGAPINYVAYPGETPVISGGVTITGFEESDGGLWSAKVPEIDGKPFVFNQLFVGGERRQLSRTPNEGYHRSTLTDREGFYYNEGDIRTDWTNSEDVRVVMLMLWTEWRSSIMRVDEERQYVRLTSGVFNGGGMPPYEREQRYFIENTLEGVDSPGEWYLDRQTSTQYYYPMEGETLEGFEAIAPNVDRTLMSLAGNVGDGQYFEYVNFQGITFRHADALITRGGNHNSAQADTAQTAAILLLGVRNCRFTEIEISQVGEFGMWFRTGCQDNTVYKSHIYDTGSGGIRIGETTTASGEADAVARITVENSLIHNGSNLFYSGPGVWIGRSSDNVIKNNEIYDYYEMGISVGWQWGYNESTANGNYIGYNRVHDIGKGVFGDMGAIYLLGVSPDTVVENNMIYNVNSYPAYMNKYMPEKDGAPPMGSGIYPDEGSSNMVFRNNIVYGVNGVCFGINYARNNTVTNNIFIFENYGMSINTGHENTTLTNNIFYGRGSDTVFGGVWTNKHDINSNVYWTDTGNEPLFKGMTFEEWKDAGWKMDDDIDEKSVVADPLFEDVENHNFTLKPESPALALGFQPIDVSLIGLQGEGWSDAASQYPLKKDDPAAPPRKEETIDEDFERSPVGEPPIRAWRSGTTTVVNGEELGKDRCLQLDGHIGYEPYMESGTVKLSYAFYRKEGSTATLTMQGKDLLTSSVGLEITLTAEGTLIANNQEIASGLSGRWITVDVTADLGEKGEPGTTMSITVRDNGRVIGEKSSLAFADGDFGALHDLTWRASGAGMYVDDLVIGR